MIVQPRATCPACGEINEAPPHKYVIFECVMPGPDGVLAEFPLGDFFTFTCRNCGAAAAVHCTPYVGRLLRSYGVPRMRYTPPDEIDDPVRQSQTPLTTDDLLDLMNDLGRTECRGPDVAKPNGSSIP